MSRLPRATFAIAFAIVSAACTLLTGVGDLSAVDAPEAGNNNTPEGATNADTSVVPNVDQDSGTSAPDSNILGNVDATVVDGCSSTACEDLPAGFQLVVLGMGECPTGFSQPTDAVQNPTFDPGACTCGCTMGAQPGCTVAAGGTINLTYGPAGGGACPSTGQAVSTGCSTQDFLGPFIAYDRRYVAPVGTLSGGNCNASATKDNSKLKTTPIRMCQATVLPQCEGKTCVPAATASFDMCIAAPGSVDCPPTWPDEHHIGASASFTCGSGCSCTVQGNCSANGSLSYFSSSNCTGAAGLTYQVNGVCSETPGSATAFSSHRYDPAGPTNVRCQNGGTSPPSPPALAGETTVCCR